MNLIWGGSVGLFSDRKISLSGIFQRYDKPDFWSKDLRKKSGCFINSLYGACKKELSTADNFAESSRIVAACPVSEKSYKQVFPGFVFTF
ncbi:MAG TPA: hypothetical protein PK776_14670 [Flavobacterium sp.]|nr:hypothetical protein [Flavobacterium sp.]